MKYHICLTQDEYKIENRFLINYLRSERASYIHHCQTNQVYEKNLKIHIDEYYLLPGNLRASVSSIPFLEKNFLKTELSDSPSRPPMNNETTSERENKWISITKLKIRVKMAVSRQCKALQENRHLIISNRNFY